MWHLIKWAPFSFCLTGHKPWMCLGSKWLRGGGLSRALLLNTSKVSQARKNGKQMCPLPLKCPECFSRCKQWNLPWRPQFGVCKVHPTGFWEFWTSFIKIHDLHWGEMGVFRAHLHMWHRREISRGPLGHSSAKSLEFLAGTVSLIYARKQGAIFFLVWSRLSFLCFGVMCVYVNQCEGELTCICVCLHVKVREEPQCHSVHLSSAWFETGSLIDLVLSSRPGWLSGEHFHVAWTSGPHAY